MIRHAQEPQTSSVVNTNSPSILVSRQTSSGSLFSTEKRHKKSHSSFPMHTLPFIPIGDWCTWSMTPHSTQELIDRLTKEQITETCITYVCRFSKIDPDFFEEFAVLSSGLFHDPEVTKAEFLANQPITYTREAVEFYISVLRHKVMPSEPILPVPQSIIDDREIFNRCYGRGRAFPSLKTISDRLDWYYLCEFQRLPARIYAIYHSQIIETPGMITRKSSSSHKEEE